MEHDRESPRTPTSRDPGRPLAGRLLVFSQNNPRRYGLSVGLLTGGVLGLVMVLSLFSAGFLETRRDLLLYTGTVLAGAFAVTALAGAGCYALVRWTSGARPLPPDADPARVLAAVRHIATGTLHPDRETNRLGRLLADQNDLSRAPGAAASLYGVILAVSAVTTALVGPDSERFALHVGVTLLWLCMLVAFVPYAYRRRERVGAFRDAYDAAEREV